MESQNIILVSADNQKIEIDTESAQKSNLLKGLISDFNVNKEPIQLPDIKYDILKKVVDYLTYYKDKNPKDIPKPMPSANLSEVIDEWDVKFINSIELDNVFDLINAANYMDIPSLLDLACAKIASLMKGKTSQEIRTMFNIECDLTEEELNLDKFSENIKSLEPYHKEGLELYSNLIHLSLNDLGLENLSNFPEIKCLMILSLKNNKLKGDDLDTIPKLYPNLYKLKISFNQINSIDKLSCLNQLQLKKLEVKENHFTKNDDEYRDKIYKMIPSLIIVDQMQKNGQEIDTSDYGNESSSFNEEEEEEGDDNDEEDSDESDGKDVDSKDSEDDYNEENEDDEGGKKKKKK